MEVQRKNPDSELSGFLYFLSEDDLLSHGEGNHRNADTQYYNTNLNHLYSP